LANDDQYAGNQPPDDSQVVQRDAQEGFKIKQVGFDRKFGREFFLEMKRAQFRIEDTHSSITSSPRLPAH